MSLPFTLPPVVPSENDRLHPGQSLQPGQYIDSANGQYRFIYQQDGNLVLYRGSHPLWAAASNGPTGHCIMQEDGNLVIYVNNTPIWASGTNGHPMGTLVMQNDGNAVIYGAVWASNTVQA
ncbi:hypothetical protein KIF53_21785 [Chromobacterium subtsugae]|uniref:Bulb-type lectin domain-containing protein n=1 Tax=Chromobacterium subtsugae TaxID=251747 RepID=A0ABS7FJL8_9NEIS|nr:MULTISPECIES: hypothetical protein [Chromobacterium]KUM03619.1 hypothetical protein Cv017_18670 [Chromobacterium subtsugae]KZE85394.1 hypothetical protein AWB61_19265 [Chromobacterium sp. F49]MBW7569180.1 hypothetical protein [Chromobacterium subtsugae]MBW8290273.1 hypothetical protein [Chromobacterium subtsugae]WSE92325.1 hypothetical protein U6115_03485 [Chromobacterium subtsugae]